MFKCEERGGLLKDLSLRRLGISEIHHLIQQLVDNDEIVPNTLLLELLEILREHLNYPVQEQQYLCRIRIPLCQCKDVEIVVSYVEILSATYDIRIRDSGVWPRGIGGGRKTHVDSLMRETWRDGRTLFFSFE